MRHAQSGLCVLLVFLCVSGCGNGEATTPRVELLSSEVAVMPDTVSQGAWVSGLATFSAVAGRDVVVQFSHNAFIGYRIIAERGALMMEFPSEEVGSPTEFVVRPGWDMRAVLHAPTLRAQADEPNRLVIWYCEGDTLPVGEYRFEAGLYGLEDTYPWGVTTFTVSSPVLH